MYSVTKIVNGMWVGICVIQDGLERSEKDTKEAAIQWVIECAKVMNHVDITEDDIKFGYEGDVVSDSLIKEHREGVMRLDDHSLNSIIKIFAPDNGLTIAEFDPPGRKLTIGESAVAEIRDLRKEVDRFSDVLRGIAYSIHSCDCPAVEGAFDCRCFVGVAKTALKRDEK